MFSAAARAAVIALLAVLALALSACAGSGGPQQAEATGNGDVPKDVSGTVRILMENVPDTDIVKSMVSEFNAEYPNVTVDIETLTYDQMRDKLVSSFQSPSATYDLIVVDNPWMDDFANAGFLQQLDARVDTTPDYLACQVAVDVLGGLASSRLVRRLVRTDETAVAVGGWTMGLVDGSGLGTITVDVSAGADVEEIEDAVCEELRRFVDEGPDAAELESVIADTERSWLSALASIEERADHISHHALLTGDATYVNTFVDRIRSVTAEQARAAAAAWLAPGSRAVVRYLAEASRGVDVPTLAEDTTATGTTEPTDTTDTTGAAATTRRESEEAS